MNPLMMLRDIRLGIKTLWLHALRSLLTMLGVMIGVASVITLMSLAEGAARESQMKYQTLGIRNILINSRKPVNQPAQSTGGSYLSTYGLKYVEAQRLLENLPAATAVVPVRRIPKKAKIGSNEMDVQVVGVTPEWFRLVQRQLAAGRVFSWEDYDQAANVCVISESLVRRLLPGKEVIGQTLNVGNVVFTIIGVIRTESTIIEGINTPDSHDDIYLPLTSCRQRFGEVIFDRGSGTSTLEKVELHQIVVEVADPNDMKDTSEAIRNSLYRVTLNDMDEKRDDFEIKIPHTLLEQEKIERRRASVLLASIAAISLLVGGIGIMNIMLASVTERTREIGIRRAIGAKRGQIISQFLIETVVLSSAGGVIGVLIGLGIPMAMHLIWERPIAFMPSSIVLSFAISVGIGVIFGIYPAIRASMLDPIEALRHE